MIQEKHFQVFPVLKTERLILRAFTDEDATGVYALRSDPRVMKYLDRELHPSVQYSLQLLQKNENRYQKGEAIQWVISSARTEGFWGDIAFFNINKQHHRAEIGYSLLPDYWGKGIMTEAAQAVIQFGFQQLGLHSITADINPNNSASRSLLLKLGFQKEAYFRESYFFDGKYLDSEMYSLLEKKCLF